MTMSSQKIPALKSFIRKPMPFLAVQITDENIQDIARMIGGSYHARSSVSPARIYFYCCNGRVKAEWGDWIVKNGRSYSRLTNEELIRDCEEVPA